MVNEIAKNQSMLVIINKGNQGQCNHLLDLVTIQVFEHHKNKSPKDPTWDQNLMFQKSSLMRQMWEMSITASLVSFSRTRSLHVKRKLQKNMEAPTKFWKYQTSVNTAKVHYTMMFLCFCHSSNVSQKYHIEAIRIRQSGRNIITNQADGTITQYQRIGFYYYGSKQSPSF